MRFQVQWDTGGTDATFSEIRTAELANGVTVDQAVSGLDAVHRQVTPGSARQAASSAIQSQQDWATRRPPYGISQQGYSQSEYFRYQTYDDARVDVENIFGHNLRA